MSDLYESRKPLDEVRALLRAVYSAEEIAEMSDAQLLTAAEVVAHRLKMMRDARKTVDKYVADGRLERAEADAMSEEDLLRFEQEDIRAYNLRHALKKPKPPSTAPAALVAPAVTAPEALPAAPVVAILSDLFGMVHALQTQVDELVYERDVFLAGFADRILDKLRAFSDGGRNYKGFEVTLDLEDEASEKQAQSTASKDDASTSRSNLRDSHAELKILASQIGALAAGHKVNVDAMNRKAASLTASSRSEVRARRKGKLTVKMGEISGPKKKATDE